MCSTHRLVFLELALELGLDAGKLVLGVELCLDLAIAVRLREREVSGRELKGGRKGSQREKRGEGS